ncbi:MAG: DUF1987 domain-containing protein [Bacteroidales bacterium]|jgi:hypothetical protein|nr:DUF1987 domain-containing protein [Bacteroidales bacterium]
MNSLRIEATTFTPEINFDIDNNTLSLFKVSKPANAVEFYRPLFEFIDLFEKEKIKSKIVKELIINIQFDYFNTATAKVIYVLLSKFKRIEEQGVGIVINWFYHLDDEDLLEEGEIMADALELTFQFCPIIEKENKEELGSKS